MRRASRAAASSSARRGRLSSSTRRGRAASRRSPRCSDPSGTGPRRRAPRRPSASATQSSQVTPSCPSIIRASRTAGEASIDGMAVASPEQYLADLNEPQREAVLATEGPLLVIAGAGSGKTRVLTYRVAHLINAIGAKPNEILAITFTNKAAGEMRERLQRLLGASGRGLWILTFHAACGRILRREAQRLGYRSNFTIYDQADQIRLVKQCLEELERDPKRFTPRGIHNQISQAKNQLVGPDEYAQRVQSFYDQTVADVYQLYQRRLFASNAVDFDDLLMLTVDVLERFPEAREKWQKAFRYILVDEYQDTNHAQYRLLQLLAEPDMNVCAVGDPDQSIYAFRGADISNILDFERDFSRDAHDRARAELPLDEQHPRRGEPRDHEQPRAQAEGAVVGARRRRPGARRRGGGRARRGALRRGRHRRARRGGLLGRRDRGLLPDERAVARARGRARAPGHLVPGDRRAALLRARRDQGRDRVPAGDRQPVRRRLADAHREPSAPRHRRRRARAPADVGRRAGPLALGGDGVRRGGGSRRRAAAGGDASSTPCCSRCSPARWSCPSPSWSSARSSAAATSRRSRPSGRSRRRGGSRTCRSSSASRASTRRTRTSRRSPTSCRRSRSTPTRTRSASRRASSR